MRGWGERLVGEGYLNNKRIEEEDVQDSQEMKDEIIPIKGFPEWILSSSREIKIK